MVVPGVLWMLVAARLSVQEDYPATAGVNPGQRALKPLEFLGPANQRRLRRREFCAKTKPQALPVRGEDLPRLTSAGDVIAHGSRDCVGVDTMSYLGFPTYTEGNNA